MTVEKARARAVAKPWGSLDPAPWSSADTGDGPIGEVWFERRDPDAPKPALLFKLLFATRPLSIQVHPDDARAHALGLADGKTEAWYVLAALPGAEVVLGLRRPIDEDALRAAVVDGSIADRVARRPVFPGDVVFVPAGTIHAVGAGLVIAEIQQASDVTWRLYDYGSGREIHVDEAIAASRRGPSLATTTPCEVSEGRTRLVVDRYFVLEHLRLPAGARTSLVVSGETWILVVGGSARADTVAATIGEAVFLERASLSLSAGPAGADLLLAHTGRCPYPSLSPLRERQTAGSPDPASEELQ